MATIADARNGVIGNNEFWGRDNWPLTAGVGRIRTGYQIIGKSIQVIGDYALYYVDTADPGNTLRRYVPSDDDWFANNWAKRTLP